MREIKTLVKQGALALLFLPLLAGTAAACPKGKKCDNVANKGKKLEEGGSKIGEKDPDSGGKKSTHKPTNKKGPLSIQAVERLNATNAAIESEREAGTRDVSAAPEAGTCTAGNCTSASDATAAANRAAQNVLSTAVERQRLAEQEQQNILAAIARGARTGQYEQRHITQMRQVFDGASRPRDEDLDGLHRNLHDGAYALRANHDELRELQRTKEEFTQVAAETSGIGQKLTNYQNNNNSLGTGSTGGRNAAAYPTVRRNPASLGSSPSSEKSTLAFKRGSSVESSENRRGSATGLFEVQTGGAADSAFASGRKNAILEAAGDAKAGADPMAPEEGPKVLNSEGKSLLAGMLKELQNDLQGGGSKRNYQTGARGPNGELINPISMHGIAEGRGHSLLGGAILSLTNEVSNSLRGGYPADQGPLASNGSLPDLDLLGVDKSLFKRVNETLRKKTSLEGGLQ